ncbi:hypothetical protein MKW98_022317, partial [Papaver atlanticum]
MRFLLQDTRKLFKKWLIWEGLGLLTTTAIFQGKSGPVRSSRAVGMVRLLQALPNRSIIGLTVRRSYLRVRSLTRS